MGADDYDCDAAFKTSWISSTVSNYSKFSATRTLFKTLEMGELCDQHTERLLYNLLFNV